jgi:hypothetical protein
VQNMKFRGSARWFLSLIAPLRKVRLPGPQNEFAFVGVAVARAFGLEAWGPGEAPGDLRPALERAVRYVVTERKAALVDVVTQPR